MHEPSPHRQLDAHTQLAGVLGYPVRHSLSPAMHNAALRALGLNWVYLAFEVPPETLPQAIAGMRGLRIQGLNLTIPHKEAVIPLLDHLTDAAQQMGAVNTLFWEGERLVGDNTDAEGFLRALHEAGIEPAGQTVLILGAGGAARAVAYALHKQECRLWIANRTPERAAVLAQAFQATPIAMTPDALRPLIPQLDGIVNCTSLGMTPNTDSSPPMDWEALPDTAWACDLVYRPLHTRFLQDAQKRGIRTIDGLGMLIHQGALALERWTGQPAPMAVMRQAAMQALVSEGKNQ
ncbi:MAG: shikimate dehydrogenase [Armatimonadetes bacterium JP3_11]|nr:MAG: shikimate dehydrogenase [Armatimonadetes bacterium JP3_11]